MESDTDLQYGEVMGITTPKTEEVPEVRERFTKLRAAIRDYVIKTVAYADPEVPGSAALSEELLYPLTNWKEPTQRSTPEEPAEEPAEEPTESPEETRPQA